MTPRRNGIRRPLPAVVSWSADHWAARYMQDGDAWFDAWMKAMATPGPTLAKRTRIPLDRLMQIARGAAITRKEIEVLAKAWSITPDGLIESLPEAGRVVG
jgi:hypothetical protein